MKGVEPIPAALIHLHAGGGTPSHALIVEKETQRLFIFAYTGGRFREIHRFPCSTGEVDGPKQRSGDRKTPEGIYFFVDRHPEKHLSPIYGSGAFPTNYPNILDVNAGRTGNAIWLHGTNKPLAPRDSNGCIVLKNKDFLTTAPYIRLNETPLVITGRLTYRHHRQAALRAGVQSVIDRRNAALAGGTYHEYLADYDPDYLPDIAWWQDWRSRRSKVEGGIRVECRSPTMVRHGDVVAAWCRERLVGGDAFARSGIKRLYLRRGNHRLSIIGESYDKGPGEAAVTHPRPAPSYRLASAAAKLIGPAGSKAEVTALVDAWIDAWSSKALKRYGSFYAEDFRSQGMNKTRWLDYKRRLNQKYSYIRITRGDLTIERKPHRIIVRFPQKYESNAFHASGVKHLILKNEANQWKIFRETWTKG